MFDRKEQYLWINFGACSPENNHKEEKENGSVLMAVGYTVKGESRETVTNYFYDCRDTDTPWIEERYGFDPNVGHTFRLTAVNGSCALFCDGRLQFERSLPSSYSAGFVRLGTGYTGTEIRSVKLCGRSFCPSGCRFCLNVGSDSGIAMPAEAFYEKNDGGYKRVFNSDGSFASNVPMLCSDCKYKDFDLEFELEFKNGFMKEPPCKKTVADPFNTYLFGPPPLEYFVDWHGCGDIADTVLHDNCLELKMKTEDWQYDRSLFISCPDIGGVRISSKPPVSAAEAPAENTAVFSPEKTLPIKSGFDGCLTGADGTKLRLVTKGSYWGLEIYGADGRLLQTLNKWNILYSEDRFLCRQYRIELPLKSSEAIFGTGERFNDFNQRGRRVRFWNTDPCYHGYSSLKTHDLWRGYKNVPIITSSRGITYFFNTTCCGEGDFGAEDETRMRLTFDDYLIDIYIWAGTPLENLKKYTALTGRQLLPPRWAFRYMAGGSNGFWGHNSKTKEQVRELLRRTVDGYKELGCMPSAMYFEGGGNNDEECYKICAENGIKALQWNCGDFHPRIMKELYPKTDYAALPMAKSLTNPEQSHYFGDFTDPASRETLKRIHEKHISWGLRGGMVDFTELVPYDAAFHNGLTGSRMHNFWVYWYSKAYHELYKELVGDDYLCYVRGGCAGSQKWNCIWTGDQRCGFDGMLQQLAAGLSISASGFAVWGTDMCGLTGRPTDEEYIRALEFNTFIPLMRTGGDVSKLPWEYGEAVVSAFKKYYRLRENLVPMIYSGAAKAHAEGVPMTMAPALAFPYDEKCSAYGSEYLFCGSILVSPVLCAGQTEKNMYFPKGTWYALLSDEVISGGGEKTVSAQLSEIPAYVRSGAVIPLNVGSSMRLAEEFSSDGTDALLITPPDEKSVRYIYKSENEKIGFTVEKMKNGKFSVHADADGGYNAALIFASALSAAVNGKSIGRCASAEEIPESGGFAVSDGKTYIKIPQGITSLVISTDRRAGK